MNGAIPAPCNFWLHARVLMGWECMVLPVRHGKFELRKIRTGSSFSSSATVGEVPVW